MKNLADLAASLQTKISAIFPDSWVSIHADENLCSSLTVRFSIEQKDNWPSKIFYNSKLFLVASVMCQTSQFEKDNASGLYKFSVLTGTRSIKARAKNKANLKQMEKHILGIFENLKENK